MTDGRKTETKSVQAIRGLESQTIAKQEQDGWHLVTRKEGKLRIELTFERERPPLPKKAFIGGAAALVVLAVIIIGGVVTEKDAPVAAAPASTTAPAPAPETTAAADPTTPAVPKPTEAALLTVKNNKDLAALTKLTDYCDDGIGRFANRYADQTIQFDGAVGAIAPHGSAKTRYDILIGFGDVDDTKGPAFQYRDKNTTSDFGWTGSDQPDSVGVGTKLRFTATVGEYDADTCLLQLDPVATQAR